MSIVEVYRDRVSELKVGKSYRELEALAEQGGYKISHTTLAKIAKGDRGSRISMQTADIIDYLHKVIKGDANDN